MNIFNFAMRIEKEAEEYYKKLASKSVTAVCRNIFDMLAADEKKHYSVLKHMKEELNAKFQDTKILSLAKDIFLDLVGEKDPFKPDLPQLALYRKALDVEKKSRDFYAEKSVETENNVQKEIFKRIAKEEEKHYTLISKVIEFISEPATFLENAEFFQNEDYWMLQS